MHARSQSPRLSVGLDRANIEDNSLYLDDSPAFRQGRVKLFFGDGLKNKVIFIEQLNLIFDDINFLFSA